MKQRRAGRFFLILVMCWLSEFCLAQQHSSGAGDSQDITILVLNGKTGKPVKDEKLNIWVGETRDPELLGTDSNGQIKVRIGNTQEKTLRLLPYWYVDCRYRQNGPQTMNLTFSLDDIVSQGAVSENFCGKATSSRVPGMLVVYMRKPTFMEAFRR